MPKFIVNIKSQKMHTSDCHCIKIATKKFLKEYNTFDKAKNCFDSEKVKIEYCQVCHPENYKK